MSESTRVFLALVNSTDTDHGLDVSEEAEFSHLASAERWINRRVDRFLGASIFEVERRVINERGDEVEDELSQRVYVPDFARQYFVLDEVVTDA